MKTFFLLNTILIINRAKVSENQLLLLIAERAKAKQENKRGYWCELSKILNTEGPCVKTDVQWKRVNIILVLFQNV